MIQETSVQAYEHVRRDLNERERKVRQVLLDHGPLALFEIARILHVPDHTISGRITSLHDNFQVIEDTGERRTNPMSGRKAIVWRLKYGPQQLFHTQTERSITKSPKTDA
ncbi:MAG TPA: hypothetical protein VGF48_05795 [Thermoanaerobaculia bacterium]|jgi:predicted ArsR family transcriptional regulator